MAEAQKEVVLTKEEVAEAQQKAAVTKDVALATTNKAQEIGLKAGFKVLCQMLLQLKLGFNVQTLDELVTTEIVDATILEAKAEHEADQRDAGEEDLVTHEDDIVRMSSAIAKETEDIEAALAMQDIEDAEVAEMVLAEEDAELAEMSPGEVTS